MAQQTDKSASVPQPPATPTSNPSDTVETLTLSDGRTLAYTKYGASLSTTKTTPVFYFNGTPGSRLECQLLHHPALALGIPLIATDRPGFGRSSYQDNRTLLQWPQDIAALADHLGISKFGVMGLSGGGPYVLACLHALPRERLVAATVVSGMYPTTLGTAGMMWQTRSLFWLAGWSTWMLEKMLDYSMGGMLRDSSPESLKEQMEKQASSLPQPAADKECMKQILQDEVLYGAYIGSMREALRTSCKGAAWEFWLLAKKDWGFRVEELDVDEGRLVVWHGALDVNVPVGMPDRVAEMVPGVEYKRLEGEGHLSVVIGHREEILEEMRKRL
jgi:pimeloyl-ACP methyl ester carboxylesterase